jgi:hypothetical protein
MAQQKLYTEEQVRKAIDFFLPDEIKKDKILETLTPIELPSDEGIYQEFKQQEIKNDISVSSRIKHITDEKDLKIIDFIIDYSFKDKQQAYTNGTILVPLYRVLDAILQHGNEYQSNS